MAFGFVGVFALLCCMSIVASGSISVFILTWNTAYLDDLENVDMRAALRYDNELQPDLYVIGLQEARKKKGSITYVENMWSNKLNSILGNTHGLLYIKVFRGLLSLIYGRITTNNQTTIEKSLNFKATANSNLKSRRKGAITTELRINYITFLFVNSHLPHGGRLNDRIESYNNIYKNIKNTYNLTNVYLFWYGDLNFRLDSTVRKGSTVINDITNNEHKKYKSNDELTQIMNAGKAFVDYKEGGLDFKPTYKFCKNNGVFYDKNRRPAWTDRILHLKQENVNQLKYGSIESFTQSDHKPVFAKFNIDLD